MTRGTLWVATTDLDMFVEVGLPCVGHVGMNIFPDAGILVRFADFQALLAKAKGEVTLEIRNDGKELGVRFSGGFNLSSTLAV